MRTVHAVTIALASLAPVAALAAGSAPPDALSKTTVAYHQLGIVRVIEHFDDGNFATVDVMPNQYRVATSGGEDPALVVQLATKPIPDLTTSSGAAYSVQSLGQKVLEGVKVSGYTIASSDKSYVVTVWLNPNNLPMIADVQTQGRKINLMFGDYNNQLLIGSR
jgi:hypothetical protein